MQRVLNERKLNDIRAWQIVDRQAHAIDGDRAVAHHKVGQAWRQGKVNEARVAALANCNDVRDPIDVALDEMPTQTVAGADGSLEVHAMAGLPGSHGRPRQGRAHGRGGKPLRASRTDGEAGAVHRDALPFGQVVVIASDAKFATGAGWSHSLDRADIVDETGEHYSAPNAY